ncbi:MAG: hypothetical protein Q9176_006654 [Flavoplaca citrina]
MFSHPVIRGADVVRIILAASIFQYTATAAVVQPSGDLIQQPARLNISANPSVGNSTKLLTYEPGDIVCRDEPWILNNPRSCEDAIQQIPGTNTPLRSRNTRYLSLRNRFSSSDGTCAVDIDKYQNDHNFAYITGNHLRSLATQVLNKCVLAPRGSEGMMVGQEGFIYGVDPFGGQFVVSLKRYNPKDIKCVDRSPEPAPQYCRAAIEAIPHKRADWQGFTDGRPSYERQIELPEMFVNPARSPRLTCMIVLDTTGADNEFWGAIYDAAVAIDAMCVRRGLQGWNNHLGVLFFNLVELLCLVSLLTSRRKSGYEKRMSLIVENPRRRDTPGIAVS